MKRLIFILIFISFSSNAFPQWLVDGGNLIWPYGNINVTNGKLIVSDSLGLRGDFHFDGDIIMPNSTSFSIKNLDDQTIAKFLSSYRGVSFGDLDLVNAGTKFTLNDQSQLIELYTADSLLINSVGLIIIGDAQDQNYGSKLIVDDDNKTFTISFLKVLLPSIPSDSTTATTGQIWYNSSTGALFRKF